MSKSTPITTWPNKEALLSQEQLSWLSDTLASEIENLMHDSSDQSRRTKRDQDLQAARAMLNEAASLFTLEEEGYFKFYSADELVKLLETAGFQRIQVHSTMGWPPQAVVATGIKPL